MLKRIFIKQTLTNALHAGPKAKRDTYKILESIGYGPLEYVSNTPNRLLRYLQGVIIIFKAMAIKNAIVFMENPIESWRFVTVATRIMRWRGNHLVLLIHDIESERYPIFPKEIEYSYINTFQSVIAHNDYMKAFLTERIPADIKIYTLGIFDYLIDDEVKQKLYNSRAHLDHNKWEVVFCGNLTREKSGFLYGLNKIASQNWALNLYGLGVEDLGASPFIKYQGSFSPDKPLIQPNSHFGLIWDGYAIDTCTGIWGDYMRMNNPHKLSLYIAINLPIIVWKEAAVARFVEDNGIGFAINNLAEITAKLSALTHNDYQGFLDNLKDLNRKVTTGDYLTTALKQINPGLQ